MIDKAVGLVLILGRVTTVGNPGNSDDVHIIPGAINTESQRLTQQNNNPPANNNPPDNKRNVYEDQLYNAINKERRRDLQWNDDLTNGAHQHSIAMANHGGIYHAGGNFGENVAMFTSFSELSPEEVAQKFTSMWMNSPGHRSNIMGGYSKTGVGVYMVKSGSYGYVYYGTQRFQ